jgi:hypothetical protein
MESQLLGLCIRFHGVISVDVYLTRQRSKIEFEVIRGFF